MGNSQDWGTFFGDTCNMNSNIVESILGSPYSLFRGTTI